MIRLLTIVALAVFLAACAQTIGGEAALPKCVADCTVVVIVRDADMKRGENSPPVTTDLSVPLLKR